MNLRDHQALEDIVAVLDRGLDFPTAEPGSTHEQQLASGVPIPTNLYLRCKRESGRRQWFSRDEVCDAAQVVPPKWSCGLTLGPYVNEKATKTMSKRASIERPQPVRRH